MNQMNVYGDLFTEVVRFEIELWDRLDERQRADTGVSIAQLQALRAIASGNGAARVQDVSDELQITVGAASKLIDRLERDGWATRAAHPSDRRSMVVTLSPQGEAAHAKAAAAADRNLRSLLADRLNEDQAAELAATLASVRTSLGKAVLS
ncbi:MarR family winged helix-turn-helix transcriptional regulator [Herbiconiux sp. P16]|uniref:MarR family winged helix-turn-helix transcriptional regulator n=1 Tax=Herbiconiux wuyangfengii TaxID=3342794 RepID=UPI0035BAE363